MTDREPHAIIRVGPGGAFRGELKIPGDKSMAHRALIFAAMADGISRIDNLPYGQDVAATATALGQLGVTIRMEGCRAVVEGTGGRFTTPDAPIDCGNSGTSLRMLTGLLAGAGVPCTLTGDRSLSRRPMGRILEPLQAMGAQVSGTGNPPTAPIHVRGPATRTIHYDSPVASAQVKSAIVLAGMFLEGETRVTEPTLSRDHTERMLSAAGVQLSVEKNGVRIVGTTRPTPFVFEIPGDPSSAAFFAAAAAYVPGSEVRFRGLSVNPTRFAFFQLLEKAGALVRIQNEHNRLNEPVADVTVAYKHKPIGLEVYGDQVVSVIDELPLVGAMAPLAQGPTQVRDAQELRVKESDRIGAVCDNLAALGVGATALPDGFLIQPGSPVFGRIDARDDHRIAMTFAILGAAAQGVSISGASAIATSYPEFSEHLRILCADCRWEREEA